MGKGEKAAKAEMICGLTGKKYTRSMEETLREEYY
jgi:hypothetical protein